MAKIRVTGSTGRTVFGRAMNLANSQWLIVSSGLTEAFDQPSFDDYAFVLSEIGTTGVYEGNFPTVHATVLPATFLVLAYDDALDSIIGEGQLSLGDGNVEVIEIDSLDMSDPGGVLATTMSGMVNQIWRHHYAPTRMTADSLDHMADNGITVSLTQELSDDGTTQSVGAATP